MPPGATYLRGLHTRLMEVDEDVTLTIATRTIALPSRFIEPITLELVITGQANTPLIYQPLQRLAIDSNVGSTCRPQYWTINGSNLEFPNLSDATYACVFRMVKGYDIASTSTNDLLTEYPGIYLYGALLQAAPYLRDDDRVQTWGVMYTNLLKKARRKESRRHALTSLVMDDGLARTRSNIITG